MLLEIVWAVLEAHLIINMNIKQTLLSIYNMLSTIETKGENTLKMAACLDALTKIMDTLPPQEK